MREKNEGTTKPQKNIYAPVEIPKGLATLPKRQKLEYLMSLHFAFKDANKLDASKIELDVLLDYIASVNSLLATETLHRIREDAIKILSELIDAVLKLFSYTSLGSLKPAERLMLTAMLVKRNCYPLFSLPARQMLPNFSTFENYTETAKNKATKSKPKIKSALQKTKFSVKEKKLNEQDYAKYIKDLKRQMIKKLEKGISEQELAELSLDEAQMISLLANEPGLEIFRDEKNKIHIRKSLADDTSDLKNSVSITVNIKPSLEKK